MLLAQLTTITTLRDEQELLSCLSFGRTLSDWVDLDGRSLADSSLAFLR